MWDIVLSPINITSTTTTTTIASTTTTTTTTTTTKTNKQRQSTNKQPTTTRTKNHRNKQPQPYMFDSLEHPETVKSLTYKEGPAFLRRHWIPSQLGSGENWALRFLRNRCLRPFFAARWMGHEGHEATCGNGYSTGKSFLWRFELQPCLAAQNNFPGNSDWNGKQCELLQCVSGLTEIKITRWNKLLIPDLSYVHWSTLHTQSHPRP